MADTLTVTDNRTGKTYTLPIVDGTIRAADLRQIKVTEAEFGMMSYDPGFLNTASTRSSIAATAFLPPCWNDRRADADAR